MNLGLLVILSRDRRDTHDAPDPGDDDGEHEPPSHKERDPHGDVEDPIPLAVVTFRKSIAELTPGHVGQADDRWQAGFNLGDGGLDRVLVGNVRGDAERRQRPVVGVASATGVLLRLGGLPERVTSHPGGRSYLKFHGPGTASRPLPPPRCR
jgi:hypothetical protein